MLNTKTIGNKIAEARKKNNISQAQLAEQLFISSQAVGKWERGESMPDITTFNRIAEILGVDLNYFSDNFRSTFTESNVNQSINTENPVTESNISVSTGKESRDNAVKKKINWDMSRGNWVDADFSGLKDLNEKFSSSNMQRCKFIGSDLSGLLLKGNNVEGCDFSESNLIGSAIQRSYFVKNQFKDCRLNEAEFASSYISGCDFTGADFTGASFQSGGLEKSVIVNAKWNSTSFKENYLSDLIFEGNVEDCYFDNCAFKRITFQNATITNTFFKNESLKGIRFIDCKADRMTYEFLKNGRADLKGISLLTE
jgi:uncharacterized protein YjbI with pentapeptide repeats